jgi:hypothetical protein
MCERPLDDSFLPMSFVPPHTTITSCLVRV